MRKIVPAIALATALLPCTPMGAVPPALPKIATPVRIWLSELYRRTHTYSCDSVDSVTLNRIFQRVTRRKEATVDDISEYIVAAGNHPWSSIDTAFFRLACPGVYTGTVPDTALIAVYGALTGVERAQLHVGGFVSYDALNMRQMRDVEHAVYDPHGPYYSREIHVNPPPELGNHWNDPAVCCPNGLPPDLGVRAHKVRRIWIDFIGPGKTERERTFWWMETSGKPVGYRCMPPRIPRHGFKSVRYRVQYQDGIYLEADMTPWCRRGREYYDALPPSHGPGVPLSQLSPELQMSVRQEIRRLQEWTIRRQQKRAANSRHKTR